MTHSLAQALDAFQPGLPLAVAYSGGADSTALLLACAEKWPGQVSAFHIHHGLQAAADDFERHCHAFCSQRGVPLHVLRVDARPAPGQSPEEAARSARYAALREAADHALPPLRHIALAQHADDQVETLLLALSRGAGLPGLSGMPAQWMRDGITYYRPLLAVSGTELREDLRARGVIWIEDPTNADEQYTRNRIRARLLPVLEAAFPQFRDTFARSAAHAAQAQRLLDEFATEDLARVGQPPQIARLRELGRDRQANLLRHWLRRVHGTAASAAQLEELLDQIAACSTRGHGIRLKVGAGHVERQGAVLAWYNP
ncbi:MAG: tRNA lysidine(34) synthetase TilS [Hylemonella sp.]|uniref:tRNA lysidine(34) synthetase TilS n=1 Tax=Hylemonella sp. TaxID=2066020 RepID=UPI0039189DE5